MKKLSLILFSLAFILTGCQTNPQPPKEPETTQNISEGSTLKSNPQTFGPKSIYLFSLQDLTSTLNAADANDLINLLQKEESFTKLQLSNNDASLTASRMQSSPEKLNAIIQKMYNNEHIYFKIIIINKPHKIVNFGTGGYNDYSESEEFVGTVATTIQEIEIKIKYQQSNSDIKAEFEKKSYGTLKAEFKDEQANIELNGEAAYQRIEPLLTTISFQTETNNAIIEQVINTLGAKPNYKKIKIEITYDNGQKIEIKQEN